jgi:pimeloyl-ACP methyl ester carboxylesterase
MALQLGAVSLLQCGGAELPAPPRPDVAGGWSRVARTVAAASPAPRPPASAPSEPQPTDSGSTDSGSADSGSADSGSTDSGSTDSGSTDSGSTDSGSTDSGSTDSGSTDGGRCSMVPPLGPGGAVPPAPPHAPLGENVDVSGDRPAYVLQGNVGDPRVIVYLHGMCGDVTAADHFREAVRAHGTLIALRGDTRCQADRFKWRADPATIQARVERAFQRVNELRGGDLSLEGALLFGYSQGADRAEKLAQRFPQRYPRIVLGGPPMKASPQRLGRAARVAILGGELETTDTMRAGFDALRAAGIDSRFFTLECAYHGHFGVNAETQLAKVLDWVSAP